ncbi:hypothetical protein CFR73_09980 [Novacetimonas maltaceti]|uniref:Uncharacterized protein n=1 Tax=Novacetimonas maltaceti TaxID=1203393 RepID=A0A2S3W4A0_9PROT|nr:hypothetical protein KMAL_08180 [Novacetimonas maltaceti]PYD59902.1 hypothetical protein CFR73_09980 [Novacetimonas maltaceti]
MVDITLSRGTKIWIEGVHGKVGSNQKWSDTYVSGAGNSVSSRTVARGGIEEPLIDVLGR